ncbi:MAG: hypothetical protein J6A04_07695 [Clostridia bacterium]|nr:hypothetical protein [Clostridia bacterium]
MIDFLDSLSGAELVALSSALAIIISQGLSPDEIDTLGNFLSALGSNLSTIAAADAEEEDLKNGGKNPPFFIK